MESLLIKTLKGEKTKRPPIWFMRQAGRILPNYMKLKESYSFHELMNDKNLASKVTLLPIQDLSVDAAILFSDILVIPHALGLNVEFQKTGPIFKNPLDMNSKSQDLEFDPSKLNYIYNNSYNSFFVFNISNFSYILYFIFISSLNTLSLFIILSKSFLKS